MDGDFIQSIFDFVTYGWARNKQQPLVFISVKLIRQLLITSKFYLVLNYSKNWVLVLTFFYYLSGTKHCLGLTNICAKRLKLMRLFVETVTLKLK